MMMTEKLVIENFVWKVKPDATLNSELVYTAGVFFCFLWATLRHNQDVTNKERL